MGEVATWKEKTARITESENLFNTVSHVIKIGSYLPVNESNYKTSVMSDGKHTLMKGNLTTSHGGKYSWSDTNVQINFALNDWTKYIPENDKIGETTTNSCFSTKPKRLSCEKINDEFLQFEGLKAVKNYLKQIKETKMPCHIITTIGLTPWSGGSTALGTDAIYWDIGGLCHIYHFIPSELSLDKKPSDDSYSSVYNQYNAISRTLDGEEENGVMLNNNGEEIGKIISCNTIKKYDTFFDQGSNIMTRASYDTYVTPKWR